MLPFFPDGVIQISDALAFKKEGGTIVYFNYQMPVFIHDESDEKTFRMITSQFCVNGNAKQCEIVAAFGVTVVSVKRGVKKFREGGPAAFYVQPKGRGKSKLTLEVRRRAQILLDEGKSSIEIGAELNIKANTIRKGISDGVLSRRTPKKKIKATPVREAIEVAMMHQPRWAWAPSIPSNES